MASNWFSFAFLLGFFVGCCLSYLVNCFHQLDINLSYFYTISFEQKQLWCSRTFYDEIFLCRPLILEMYIMEMWELQDFLNDRWTFLKPYPQNNVDR